jgi:hypothetical protein
MLAYTRGQFGAGKTDCRLRGQEDLGMLATDSALSNVINDLETVDEIPVGGRRIYIHSYSLRCLCRHSTDLAGLTTSLLAEVRGAKIIHHHIVDQGVGLGLVRKSVADQLLLQHGWTEKLSEFFRTLGYRPCFPTRRESFLKLIDQEEKIIASCSVSGYYTFATGTTAAEHMFADEEPVQNLQRNLNRGDGPTDLTMIRGNSLAEVDCALGVGRVGSKYNALVLRKFALTEAELDAIDSAARSNFIEGFQSRISPITQSFTADERQVFGDTLSAIERSFEKMGSLSL